MIKDYYRELHIHPKAVPELVSSSYKILKEKYQRDIHPDELESWLSGLEEAYQVLSDPDKRKKYDQVYFQEFGGIVELERRLNKHRGLLMTLSSVFVILIGVAIFFLYSIKKPLEPKSVLIQQIDLLKEDLDTFMTEKGKFPTASSSAELHNSLNEVINEREEAFWSKITKYELTPSGKYRITLDTGERVLIITKDSTGIK